MKGETREKLINAAGEVFAEQGFEAATVRCICLKAGANLAAVNYHFGDKEQLYFEAVKAALRHHPGALDFRWSAETPPEQKLSDVIQNLMRVMLATERPSWHLKLVVRELTRPTAACAELVRGFIGPTFEQLMAIVGEMLPPNSRPLERRLHALSVIGQCLLFRDHCAIGCLLIGEEELVEHLDSARVADHITRFCIAGMKGAAN
jgi:AcrR family transcriptional regulator